MIGKVLAGRYKVYEEVGSGGLATVYVARNIQTNQIVAVKVLHPHTAADPDTRVRFEREASLARQLDDPHVVRVLEYGHEGDQPFLVMEFVEGNTLKAFIKAKGKLPVDQSLFIARQVAEGLSVIHQRGIIHRDIKPQNIMIRPDGLVKVMDFGIARSTEMNTLTGSGLMVGTPYYIAPEQVRGEKADQRADIYSLGVVLYEMLTGQLLFSGDSPITVLMKHLNDPVPSSWAQHYNTPQPLANLVNRCLAKKPAERYQNAQELINGIDSVARSQKLTLDVGQTVGSQVTARKAAPAPPPDTLSSTPARAGRLMPHPPQRPMAAPVRPMAPPVPTLVQQRKEFPWLTMSILGGVGLCLILVILALLYASLNGGPGPATVLGLATAASQPSPTSTRPGIGTTILVVPTKTATIGVIVRTPTQPPIPPTQQPTLEPPPPPPTVAPTPKPPAGFISLQADPPQEGLWAVVQWQDAQNNWNNVDGWWRPLREGKQVWEVFPAEFGKGPFRWEVLQGQGGPVLGQSTPFFLPNSVGQTVRVSVSLTPANHPPVVQAIFAEASQVEVNRPLKLRAVALDPDGDPLQYEWTAVMGAVSGSDMEAVYNAPGMAGVYPVSVAVSDGKGGRAERSLGVQVTSASAPPDAREPQGKFGKVWHENPPIAHKVGLALEDERAPQMAREEFERGKMLYVGDAKHIYLFTPDGRWWRYDDTWSVGQMDEDPALIPPPGLFQPRAGFGKVWREQLRGTSLDPGWARSPERGYTGAAMRFERGVMLWTDERLIYVLSDDGAWRVFPDLF